MFNLVNPENSDSWNCLSEVEGQELMDVIQKVKDYGGQCILTVTAKRDIYSQGPLLIDVRVERKGDNP